MTDRRTEAIHELTEQRMRDSFATHGLMTALGARMEAVGDATCTILLPFSDKITQHHGYFHGGAIASIADSAAGFASFTTMTSDQQPLTVEFKISFLAPARGERLEAIGRVIRSGRRLKHARADVFAISGDTREHVAAALATISAASSGNRLP